MKKISLLLILMFILSGCSKKTDVEDLISAYELPEYSAVEIEVSSTDESDTDNSEVISID